MIPIEAMRENLQRVQGQIAEAARQAGRSVEEIKLVLVTKGQPPDLVKEVLELGVKRLGESYAEEGIQKMTALADYEDIKWHMIGHVQSRKAGLVADHFAILHSLDSFKLARRLDRTAAEAGRRLPVLLQINVSGEESKYGFPAPEAASWNDWHRELEGILRLPNLRVRGLMSLAPLVDDADKARPYFERTRLIRDALASNYADQDWRQLSMGMSNDFQAAIQEGATLLRIGTAILGPRPT